MNIFIQFTILAILVNTALISTAAGSDRSVSTNSVAKPQRSIFDLPNSVKEGRDPFFPESTRMAEAASASTTAAGRMSTEVSSLKVPGISGTPGHMYAIINNHTFAVGDEGDVLTPNGRIHLRCIEIEPDAVIIQVAGRIHRIKLDSE